MDGEPTPKERERGEQQEAAGAAGAPRGLTLNTAVRRRRADRAFSIRLAGAIRQQQRALERLKR